MDKQDAYKDKLEARIDEQQARFERWKAQLSQTIADRKVDAIELSEELEKKFGQARAKLDELKDAGEEAAGDIREGAERAWKELSDSMRRAGDHFER